MEVAKAEGLPPEKLRDRVAQGKAVILKNVKRVQRRMTGLGEGLRTKVNVNIGASSHHFDLEEEIRKVELSNKYGADSLMDLTDGGDIKGVRAEVLKRSDVPVGTVPVYEVYAKSIGARKYAVDFTEDDLFRTIREQLEEGVDFITVHTGITLELVRKYQKVGRTAGIVSRGGTILASWMLTTGRENPLYREFDYILEMASEFDVTLSLGDALRPGSVLDAHDQFQVSELVNNSNLARRAVEAGVQVMLEGPGHVPLDRIESDVKLEKSLTGGKPYYVLGMLPIDTGAGYDHIAGAIGGAMAAAAGADMLCYLTPAEHLSLPTPEQVKDGLIAFKIAARAGDLVKYGNYDGEREMSLARASLDWSTMFRMSPDPERASAIFNQYRRGPEVGPCTMCGDMCVYVVIKRRNGPGDPVTQGREIRTDRKQWGIPAKKE